MAYSYHITFVEVEARPTGCGQLAARMVNDLGKDNYSANTVTLDDLSFSSHAFDHNPTLKLLTAQKTVNSLPQAILIGLCLTPYHQTIATIKDLQYQQNLATTLNTRLKQVGIVQDFPMIVYWDLSHLNHLCTANEAVFHHQISNELQQRVRLLVASSF